MEHSQNSLMNVDIMMQYGPNALEIITSCNVCQKLLRDIYADNDGNDGLRTTQDPNHGIVTKLWMTECGHLTCGKHLEGAGEDSCLLFSLIIACIESLSLLLRVVGVPFHPEHQLPRAVCPICKVQYGDWSTKALFFIRGARDGEYDDHIPKSFFTVPPVELEDAAHLTEALTVSGVNLPPKDPATYENSVPVSCLDPLQQGNCSQAFSNPTFFISDHPYSTPRS